MGNLLSRISFKFDNSFTNLWVYDEKQILEVLFQDFCVGSFLILQCFLFITSTNKRSRSSVHKYLLLIFPVIQCFFLMYETNKVFWQETRFLITSELYEEKKSDPDALRCETNGFLKSIMIHPSWLCITQIDNFSCVFQKLCLASVRTSLKWDLASAKV